MDPHHRIITARKVIVDGLKSKDLKVTEIVRALTKEPTAKPALVRALDKFLHAYQRTVLDTFCLGRATLEEIHNATEIPMETIAAYQEYLFDQTQFQDGLDRITWVQEITPHLPAEHAKLLQSVLTIGVRYVTWLLTGRGNFTPSEVLRHTMNDALFRSMAHRNAPLNSDIAREAHQWIRTAERLARALHAVNPADEEEARKQLHLALTYDDTTVSNETADVSPDNILH